MRTLLTLAFGVIAIGAASYLVTRSSLYRFHTHWDEAETLAAEVKRLSEAVDSLSHASVHTMLNTNEFAQLRSRIISIELEPGELVWFHANDMYNVGLVDDGGIRFMRDGRR